ncbi:unnamed protein product [Didymodactylos carnosus]|uniref:Carboxylic ester hydrolase n=1 Tax=Didymodactylos carnosus TaxID=1234261 RepID=A0A814GTD6_9BILA|nr:unnamed protein product [Didymodactylos carnosus]CAF3772207.1 unnamed protein product [Didymodactylos carnosus]
MTRDWLFLLAVVCVTASDASWAQLKINTPSLGTIQGELNPNVANVRQFIGIPFAQPPIGNLRFKPPVSTLTVDNASSTIIYNATAAAHQGGFPLLDCMQLSLLNSSVILGQEDCLYLDIFLPLNVSTMSLLPVIIYIYGGGFQTSDPHDPSHVISLYQNVIYVAIRYRVNVFGFMASTLLSASRSGAIQASGLQGFEDQQMAMRWVRDNIQSFGGDPRRVTLQGHSAGAISVCLHLIAPASQDLFQRAIIESGGCDVTQLPLNQMEVIGDEISSYFCNSSADVISCLQSINASTLLQYAQSKDYLNFFSPNAIHPPIDGLIIPDSITNLFQQNKFATNVSLLSGTVNAEFGLFIAGGFETGWQIRNLSQTILSQWVQLFSRGQSAYLNSTYNPYVAPYLPPTLVNYFGLTDALSTGIFQCPVRRTVAHLASNGTGSVYLYSFDYIPLSSPFADLSQSVHGQELPFVFNTPNSSALTQIIFPVSTFTVNEQLLASTMSLLWTRFVVNGNPNAPLDGEATNPLITQLTQLGGWPAYSVNATTNLSSYLIFANTATGNSSATLRLSTNGTIPRRVPHGIRL